MDFVWQSKSMESNWVAEHLQTIRTLMERSAVYRRALAPMMLMTGAAGLVAAGLGWALGIVSPSGFVGYWLVVGVLALVGAFLLARRQAFKAAEPFWSPPTRRVAQAITPPLAAGLLIGILLLIDMGSREPSAAKLGDLRWLPPAWAILYGCGIHAAGFFMPRGMKLFGWIIILTACLAFAIGVPPWLSQAAYSHGLMGFIFGLLHLAYGLYLCSTEKRKNEA
jgi:hypothetical protein